MVKRPLSVTAALLTTLTAAAMLVAGGAAAAAPMSTSEPRPDAADKVFTGPCSDNKNYECGTVEVPLNYDDPAGQKIKVAVTRAKATGTAQERQGVILFNPGGPGGSGRFWANAFPAEVRKAYDIIGFDPRGVGLSAPIHCVDAKAFFKQPAADTNDPKNFSEFIKRAKEYAEGCAAKSGNELQYINTPNTARDMDEIRDAIGEPKINYYGVSYGTYLGVVYGQLFPNHVRRMLIDSNINADTANIWYQANLDQDVAFQARVEQWFTWIAKYDSVFHLGTSEKAVYDNYLKARNQLKAKPAGTVGADELDLEVVNSGYYDIYWVFNAQALSDYLTKNDSTKLQKYAKANSDQTTPDFENSNAVYTAVECGDAKWPRSIAKWLQDNQDYNAKAPLETYANAWMNLPCAYWKAPQQTPLTINGKGLPPIMMLQGTMDAATPFEGAVRTHQLIPSSRMIIEQGGGSHGLYNEAWVGNKCIDGYATDYLLKGQVPDKDVVCPGHPQPDPTKQPAKS